MLNVEQVMTSPEFSVEDFDRPRWWSEGSWYTTIHRKTQLLVSSIENKTNVSEEILLHNACTGDTSVVVKSSDLISIFEGATQSLPIDDYATSSDRKKILIFTNAQKVWRLKTRGSYWVLALEASSNSSEPKIHQLGCTLSPNSLMFATFSPDGSRVAYVSQNNIYVEELENNSITQLTHDGSDLIINGTFDWYECILGM